jgi:isopenicillin-N epimerase
MRHEESGHQAAGGARSLPPPSALGEHWTLARDVVFLNHGSFGAAPRAVLAEQAAFREQMEQEPVRFFVERHAGLVEAARHAIAGFVRCDPEGVAMMPNASTGVATVFDNVPLRPGDEVLLGDHEYPACRNTLRRACARRGAVVVPVAIPFPVDSPDRVVEAYVAAVTPRTRLALVSHVTSPTALVLPVDRIVRELRSRGVDVLVDGAHAPGMIPWLDVGALGAPYYVANCHKWVCAPKGAAFVWVRPDRREGFRPLVLSNNAENPRPGRPHFVTEFEYAGTTDYTPWYSVPRAIHFMGGLLSGWPEVCGRNRDLCLRARAAICRALEVPEPAPPSMIGSMAVVILPPHDPERHERLGRRPTRYHDALQDALLERWRIQVPIWGLPGRPERFVRISAQVYNSPEQYDYLAQALRAELAHERSL